MTDDPITAWYRTCTAGAITARCCAQVASIIWYLRMRVITIPKSLKLGIGFTKQS